MKVCQRCKYRFDSIGWQCGSCGYQPSIVNGFLCFAQLAEGHETTFDATDFAKLFDLEGDSFWFIFRNKLITWALAKYFPGCNNFLEIGCGTGFVLNGITNKFPRLSVAGSDLYTEGLSFALKRNPNADLFQMDATDMPFEAEYDIIGAFDILEHIEEDAKALQEMRNATKIGGGIIITVPQHPNIWSSADVYARHVRRYTKGDLIAKVEKCGFHIIRATSFISLLFPVMAISRLYNKRNPEKYDPTEELQINNALSKTLGIILGLELILIQSGFSFPFGGSLMIVAKKE